MYVSINKQPVSFQSPFDVLLRLGRGKG